MTTEIIIRGHNVVNIYRGIAPSYEFTSLHVAQTDGAYQFTTLVNTRFVAELKNFVWFRLNTNDGIYFATSLNNAGRAVLERLNIFTDLNRTMLLHRFVAALARVPNPNNEPYVDHISRETLDNRMENLRWLSQSDQNRNQNKKRRQANARQLPTDIEQGELPKYITWNVSNEISSSGNMLTRKFFRIESHPALNGKQWSTSKAEKFTNQDKLNQAKAKLIELDALVDPDPDLELRNRLVGEYNLLMGV